MSRETDIAYADSTINPCVGCMGCELHSKAAPGNSTCYAAALTARYAKGNRGWPASFDQPQHFPGRLEKALKWPDLTGARRPHKPWLNGYPRVVFVNDLSDGWHSIDPDIWLTPHLQAMAESPHIWLFSTKRPDVMRKYFEGRHVPRNFWLMTTVTSQPTAWRIEELLHIRGDGLRLLSMEPLLGLVDVSPYLYREKNKDGRRVLDGVFVGGASGPRAPLCDVAWIRSAVEQCRKTWTAVLVKQLGASPYAENGVGRERLYMSDSKGGNEEDWPEGLRVRVMPDVPWLRYRTEQ